MIAVNSEANASHNPRVAKLTAIVMRAIIVHPQVALSGLFLPLIDGMRAKEKLKQASIMTISCHIILKPSLPSVLRLDTSPRTYSPE